MLQLAMTFGVLQCACCSALVGPSVARMNYFDLAVHSAVGALTSSCALYYPAPFVPVASQTRLGWYGAHPIVDKRHGGDGSITAVSRRRYRDRGVDPTHDRLPWWWCCCCFCPPSWWTVGFGYRWFHTLPQSPRSWHTSCR